MRLFHYTVGTKIQSILNDGFIQTSPKKPAYGETPLAWLSSNENYEETARKAAQTVDGNQIILTIDQMNEHASGVFRFVFEVNPSENNNLQDWTFISKKCGISSKLRRILLDRAKLVGANPDEWWGYIKDPMPLGDAKLEKLIKTETGFTWVDVDFASITFEDNGILSMTVSEMEKAGFAPNMDNAWNKAKK